MAKSKAKNKGKVNSKKKNTVASQGTSANSNIWIGLGLAFFSVLLFANTFGHGFTVDDPLVISQNKIVQKGIPAIGEIWSSSYLQGYNGVVDAAYRPMSLTSFAIEKSLFDGSERAMHIMHVLYFALGVLLCYLFSLKLFRDNKVIAIITTLLFLAHPIHTEVVNNLKSRDEILMLVGLMGSGFFYLKYLEGKYIRLLISSLAFFFIALFSKESAISFFLMIPLLYLWYRQKWEREALQHGAYYLVLSFVYLSIRTSVVGSYNIDMDYMNNALLANDGGIIGRFPDAMMLMGKYLIMLLVPYPLSVDYSFNSIPMNGWSSMWPYLSLMVYSGLVYLAYDGIRKKRIYGVVIPWFLISIVVASNVFILIGSTFAERFLFVPSFAFCAAVAYYLNHYLGKKALIIAVVISVIFGGWTFIRSQDWKSDLDLFTRDVQYQQDNARVQTFFGRFTHLAAVDLKDDEKSKQLDIAKNALDKATNIAPDYMIGNYFQGLLAKELKNNDLAMESFARVVELDGSFKDGRLQYAIALRKKKDYKSAVEQYVWLLNNGRADIPNYNNTGFCYFQLKEYENAVKYYIKAHELDPRNEKALSSIVTIYSGMLRDPVQAKLYREKLKALK